MGTRAKARTLAAQAIQKGDAVGWFEQLYAEAGGSTATIPWAEMRPNPNLVQWYETGGKDRLRGPALVVGCGLGDDAEFLAAQGVAVVAFDISPTAIAWCRRRFPGSRVEYCVQDLFASPKEWQRAFGFVMEAYTLQAFPGKVRGTAQERMVEWVAPGGRLLVIARGREATEPEGDLPWPLLKTEFELFVRLGLTEAAFEDYVEREPRPVRRFRGEYVRVEVST
jgi:hypothetical protein